MSCILWIRACARSAIHHHIHVSVSHMYIIIFMCLYRICHICRVDSEFARERAVQFIIIFMCPYHICHPIYNVFIFVIHVAYTLNSRGKEGCTEVQFIIIPYSCVHTTYVTQSTMCSYSSYKSCIPWIRAGERDVCIGVQFIIVLMRLYHICHQIYNVFILVIYVVHTLNSRGREGCIVDRNTL